MIGFMKLRLKYYLSFSRKQILVLAIITDCVDNTLCSQGKSPVTFVIWEIKPARLQPLNSEKGKSASGLFLTLSKS